LGSSVVLAKFTSLDSHGRENQLTKRSRVIDI
jgi:hypothetical protein